MSGANYEHCRASNCLRPSTKTIYVGDMDVVDDVSTFHKECIEAHVKAEIRKTLERLKEQDEIFPEKGIGSLKPVRAVRLSAIDNEIKELEKK